MKLNTMEMEKALANSCMTNEELANKTGLKVATISRIKNGKQNPRPSTIGKIAKALNVNLDVLIG